MRPGKLSAGIGLRCCYQKSASGQPSKLGIAVYFFQNTFWNGYIYIDWHHIDIRRRNILVNCILWIRQIVQGALCLDFGYNCGHIRWRRRFSFIFRNTTQSNI